ncbi:MAG: hypothetical protein Q9177_000088 [Variospora cf. flavescens]
MGARRQDYDCFYAAVFEKEDPALRLLPLAVQQKHIIVTCNYVARRHGLYKLQKVTEARQKCPDAVVVLGEDLNRFRNASKENYNFLRRFAWSGQVERLGFDEVFIDVTDMVDYNLGMINQNALHSSFFHLSRYDPTSGFEYDGRRIAGHTVPELGHTAADAAPAPASIDEMFFDRGSASLYMRLMIGSHLAQYLRHQLEQHQGYTSTVGISTSKLISKLIGNVNKPKGQTTLLPPYSSLETDENNVTKFLDSHDIGQIPGIGFRSAQRIQNYLLGRPAAFGAALVHGGIKERMTVRDVRLSSNMGIEPLERLLGGSGAPKGIGAKIWGLVNGVDNSEVSKARDVEDSYIKLDTMTAVKTELLVLSQSLLSRVREDLSCVDNSDEAVVDDASGEVEDSTRLPTRQWLACPRTLRLSTRPRQQLNPDRTRSRPFNRISRSCDMPSSLLDLSKSIEELSQSLVQETLIPLFHKLHPEKSGWNLTLMNLCVTNISSTAASRDISKMFRRQKHILKEWDVKDDNSPNFSSKGVRASGKHNEDALEARVDTTTGHEVGPDALYTSQKLVEKSEDEEIIWQSDDDIPDPDHRCGICGLPVPYFAVTAHDQFHNSLKG